MRRVLACLIVPIVISGCVTRDEVARVSSPDGQVDAILIEENGGAMTDFGYYVEVGRAGARGGKRVAYLYGAVRSSNAYGVNMKWNGNDELRLEYMKATEQKQWTPTLHIAGRDLTISLKSGVVDSSAASYHVTKPK